MCPGLPRVNLQTSSNPSARIPPAAWIASARCTTAAFRRHLTTHRILCNNCYSTLAPRRRNLYEHVIRHYITLGNNPQYEECTSCSRVLVVTALVREATCGECPGILSGFLVYIVRHGLTPFNENEATVVVIRQFRA